MTGCVSSPKANLKVPLPPKPERVERPEAESVKDLIENLNYYNELVSDWESWADTVEKIYNAQ